jgi:hypothetical protein
VFSAWPRPIGVLVVVFTLLVVAKASAYWIGSAIQRPDDPLSTVVLYRGKDIESLPIVRNLANFGLGEPALYESYNSGVLQERLIPWIPHALLFRLFGESGFIVADLLLTPLRFALLAWVFHLCGLPRAVAIAVGALLTCSAIDDFGEVFPRLFGIPIRFWGLRLPRPFLSEFFLLLALGAALVALRDLRGGRQVRVWPWAVAGGGLAVLLQCDLYSATALGLAFVGVATGQWLTGSGAVRAALLRGLFIASIAALACTATGVLQYLYTNPQSIVRLGLFPASRLSPFFIDAIPWYLVTAALALGSWVLTRWRIGDAAALAPAQRTAQHLMLAMSVGALLAMPLTTVLIGKGIQLYHYRDVFTRCLSLTLVIYGLHAGEAAWRWIRRRQRVPTPGAGVVDGLSWSVVVASASLCVLFAWRFAVVNPTRSDHMRSDFPEWAALPDYRGPFVELAKELASERYDQRPVLGTFDHQVWAWWVTFRGGYSYLADACTSNVTNDELETRSIQLAKLHGMTQDEFAAFARRRYVMIFWMSCSRYQGTRAYAYAPLEDYTPEDQERIRTTPDYWNFAVALPLSQQERLRKRFEAETLMDLPRLDLIVTTRDGSLVTDAPSADLFELSYENRLFQVWIRRGDAVPAYLVQRRNSGSAGRDSSARDSHRARMPALPGEIY